MVVTPEKKDDNTALCTETQGILSGWKDKKNEALRKRLTKFKKKLRVDQPSGIGYGLDDGGVKGPGGGCGRGGFGGRAGGNRDIDQLNRFD
uniref:Uncharacterized protein n=1 Tax=Cannabis sativa TaxID=3483 RepID=A0A803P121_CANSA